MTEENATPDSSNTPPTNDEAIAAAEHIAEALEGYTDALTQVNSRILEERRFRRIASIAVAALLLLFALAICYGGYTQVRQCEQGNTIKAESTLLWNKLLDDFTAPSNTPKAKALILGLRLEVAKTYAPSNCSIFKI